jgi:hypothetical protein
MALKPEAVTKSLVTQGARQWQADIVGPLIAAALLERKPKVIATEEATDAQ